MENEQSYFEDFTITQAQVQAFADLTGDNNPLHVDEAFAAKSIFKQRIVHGFLAGSIFSKIIGTSFPGNGSIYLSQNMSFLKPIYPGKKYQAQVTIKEIQKDKFRIILETNIIDAETKKVMIKGDALVMNEDFVKKNIS